MVCVCGCVCVSGGGGDNIRGVVALMINDVGRM
jgi:hypothetical protein